LTTGWCVDDIVIGIIDIWNSYGAPGVIIGTVIITYGIIFDIISTVK
jgi:hypothetical protein